MRVWLVQIKYALWVPRHVIEILEIACNIYIKIILKNMETRVQQCICGGISKIIRNLRDKRDKIIIIILFFCNVVPKDKKFNLGYYLRENHRLGKTLG